MLRQLRALVALCALPLPVSAADLHFCWVGAGGYTMTGFMRIPDDAMSKQIVTQDDVTRFKIIGYADGERIGTWSMDQRRPETTWYLRFHPATMTFPTGGSFLSPVSQGWNADGTAADCGNPGFGFNSGNNAQDVCINGVYIVDSSIPPRTPFIASTTPVDASCGQRIPLSKAQIANQPLDGESPLP